MPKRLPFISLLIVFSALALVSGITVAALLSSGAFKTTGLDTSIVAALISIVAASIGAVIVGIIIRNGRKKKEGQLALLPRLEQINKAQELLRLELQKSELEKKQQTLQLQLEALLLAMEDPRLAIIIAYQGVEMELQRVVNQLPTDIQEEVDKQRFSGLYNISLLEKHIGTEDLETFKQMYDLRNRIIHGEVKPDEVSKDKAMGYVQRAINMTRVISSLGEYERLS